MRALLPPAGGKPFFLLLLPGCVADAKKPGEGIDLEALGAELKRQLGQLGTQAKEVLDKVSEDVQYEFDKQLARALAKHPDLYAEVRKTMRQVQKTVDKAAEALGLKEK